MDAEDGDGNQRTRISPEAVSALFGLFTNKQWLPQLPRGSKLTGDSDYSALASKYGFDRTQAARQYVKWREWGQASNERDQTNPVDREPVRFLLEKRVPDYQKVVDAAFVALLKHPFLSERVWFHDTLKEIELRGNALWMSRVSELGDLFVKHYSSASSKQRSCSTSYAVDVLESGTLRKEEWSTNPEISAIIRSFDESLPRDFDCDRESFPYLMLTFVVDYIKRAFNASFAPSVHGNLEIRMPQGGEREIYTHPVVVAQVLYYISGYLLSALIKSSKRSHCPLFDMFVVHNSFKTANEARSDGLDPTLVVLRNQGSLIYSSKEFYKLVCTLEHGFSYLLTMPNVVAFGPAIIAKATEAVSSWSPLQNTLDACLMPIREKLSETGFTDIDVDPLLKLLMKAYMRMRGRDFVRTLLARLKRSAANTNTTRGGVAAAAVAAGEKAKKIRTAEEEGGGSCDFGGLDEDDCFGALDEDFKEVMASFANDAREGVGAEEEVPILTFELEPSGPSHSSSD